MLEIFEALPVNNLKVEKVDIGKVIKVEDRFPTVICGSGCIKIMGLVDLSGKSRLPLLKFRTRFK